MTRRWAIRGCLVLCVVLVGCTKKRTSASGAPGASLPTVDVTKDREQIAGSWILSIARDPGPMGRLADSSPGWGALFKSDPAEAYQGFQASIDATQPVEQPGDASESARIGAARAALRLAHSHQAIAEIVVEATPVLLNAQSDAEPPSEFADWSAYVLARHAARVGKDPAPLLAKIHPDGPVAPWAAALAPGAKGPLTDLLLGRAEGLEAAPPEGGSQAYVARLRLAALVSAGRLKAVRKGLGRLGTTADIRAVHGESTLALYDPFVADVAARAYAALALQDLGELKGWANLWRARALALLGRHAEGVRALDQLLATPPQSADLANLVLTPALDAADLISDARAERVRLLAISGRAAEAKTAWGGLPRETIGDRVRRAWAGTFVGQPVDPASFPQDSRGALSKALTESISQLGKGAHGVVDVTNLALVDRYVDAVERRFAEALEAADEPAIAIKARAAAEDKAHAMSPSPRNTLPALAAMALANVRIRRYRVALKYLSRMMERLPAVAIPAEFLRDLLTIRAMDLGDGAPGAGQ